MHIFGRGIQNQLEMYAGQITKVMDAGQEIDAIEIPLKLSIVKPLHAQWLIEMFNEMTSDAGRNVCLKGWHVSGIKEAVETGLSKPLLDPFEEIDPMMQGSTEVRMAVPSNIAEAAKYVVETNAHDDDDEEDWIDENDADGNIFDSYF